ncbi:ester cyclase [Defluviimonas sp. WL0050]|uniref:Ester cyclase n=1 Tax=Albidovulum litorale TaxID=2984134 RepID=A0ABT2ZSI1_9RHOB|nr:ester cyclase [Defluviimonas sp. WL0050]MCV2874110.1 ester cyclase [Defluviimonas sp. WL0050]
MTDTQVTDFVSRFETVLNGHDLTGSADLFTADFVDHAPWPGQSPDAAGFAAGLGEMIAAFPDLRVDVQRTVAEGDMLTTHFFLSGSQLGEFMGSPASGKTFNVEAIDILRMRDGRIVEHWGVIDAAAMAEQLGL